MHTRPRLIHHLKHGTTDCLSRYIVNHPVLTGDEVAKLDDLDRTARKKLHARGLRETHARIPALHTMSPAIFHLEPTLEHIALSQPVAGPTCILPDSEEGTQQIAGYRLDNSQTTLVILCAQGPQRCINLQFKVEILAAIRGIPILFLHADVTSSHPLCNITLQENMSFWTRLILTRRVWAFVSLVPQDTWNTIPDQVPMRTRIDIWGVLTGTQSVFDKAESANGALQFMFYLFHVCQAS